MQRGEISILARVLFASPGEVQEVMPGGGGRQIVPKGCAELTGRRGWDPPGRDAASQWDGPGDAAVKRSLLG